MPSSLFRAAAPALLLLVSCLSNAASLEAPEPLSPPVQARFAGAGPSPSACPYPVAVRALPFAFTEDYSRPHKTMLPAGVRDETILGYVRAVFANTRSIEGEADCPQMVVRAGYAPVSLVVASELASDECALNRIRNHELEHIEAYRRNLATLEARSLAAIQASFSGPALREPGALAQAGAAIQALVQTQLETVIQDNRVLDEDDAAIADSHACDRVLARRTIFRNRIGKNRI